MIICRNGTGQRAFSGVETFKNSSGDDEQATATIQRFTWSPDPDLGYVRVQKIKIVIISDNITSFNDYANISALANGVAFGLKTEDGEGIYAVLKNNAEIPLFSSSAGTTAFDQKGNNTQSGIVFVYEPNEPLEVNYQTTFFVDVRDDLSAIETQKASVFYEWRV